MSPPKRSPAEAGTDTPRPEAVRSTIRSRNPWIVAGVLVLLCAPPMYLTLSNEMLSAAEKIAQIKRILFFVGIGAVGAVFGYGAKWMVQKLISGFVSAIFRLAQKIVVSIKHCIHWRKP